jgi:hypothetical protein
MPPHSMSNTEYGLLLFLKPTSFHALRPALTKFCKLQYLCPTGSMMRVSLAIAWTQAVVGRLKIHILLMVACSCPATVALNFAFLRLPSVVAFYPLSYAFGIAESG